MKKLLVISLFCISKLITFSQPTVVQWQKGFGGSSHDVGGNIIQKINGEFIIFGHTMSNDHDVITNHGFLFDVWVLNLTDTGRLISNKCFGGTAEEYGLTITEKDNELILFGTARSDNFDLDNVHDVAFGADLWMLQIDSLLNIISQKTLGSASSDQALKFIVLNNGGYMFLGRTGQAGNDVDSAYGNFDLWVCKTDSNVNIEWQLTLGSSSDENGGDIVQTLDFGYLVVGGVSMNDGSITCQPFGGTILLTKINSSGVVMWQKCFSSAYAKKVIATSDGGFVVAAMTFDNTMPGYSDLSDYLLFKIDSLGNQQWAHCYGGSMFDEPNDLIQCSDGGFIIAGTSDSYDFYATTNHGGSKDALLVKVDSLGNFQWSQCYGGIDHETCNSVIETSDGGLAITGSTKSVIGLPHYGFEDLWVLKLNYIGNGIVTPDNSIEYFRTYATVQGIGVEFSSKQNQEVLISIYDILGKKIHSDKNEVMMGKVNFNYNLNESRGVLLIELKTADGRIVNKLIK